MIDTKNKDIPICPYCGVMGEKDESIDDSMTEEIIAGGGSCEATCCYCGKFFMIKVVEKDNNYIFSTSKL